MSTDEDKINSWSESFMQAYNTGDVTGWMATLTDDIVFMPPDEEAISGSDAVRAWAVENLFKLYAFNLRFSFDELEVAGLWAFARGRFQDSYIPKDGGDTIEFIGKFVDIFRLEADGKWKLARIIFNSDCPTPAV